MTCGHHCRLSGSAAIRREGIEIRPRYPNTRSPAYEVETAGAPRPAPTDIECELGDLVRPSQGTGYQP